MRGYMKKYERILIKVSGEALSDGFGIDSEACSKLAFEIKSISETGVQLGIVVGGGNFWRGRTSKSISRAVADNIGMLATVMNGLALGEFLTACGVKNRVVSSFAINKVVEGYYLPNVEEYLNQGTVVIFAGGTGVPFFSTDTALTLRACELRADAVFFMKNIDGIYDSDPKLNPNAKKYDEISYDKIISDDLKAMDLTAIVMCKEFGMQAVALGKDEPNGILRVLNGEKLGTIIR